MTAGTAKAELGDSAFLLVESGLEPRSRLGRTRTDLGTEVSPLDLFLTVIRLNSN